MATLVLIPGAWLGGWVWARVAPDLRARGHTVYTPTLTGLGERAHLLDTDVDLDLHATDVCQVLEYEDIGRAVLVGHGYGGAVAQRVAALLPERIGRIAFLDAILGRAGASLEETLGEAATLLRTRAFDDDGVPVYAPDAGLVLDGLVKRDADWVEDRLTPMPIAPYQQVLDLGGFFARVWPVLSIRCARGEPAASEMLARDLGYAHATIEAGHLPMIARPEPTAELLDNFARQPAARFSRHDAAT